MLPFVTNHRFISFMLYTIGFVGFVASLQRQYLKSQFGLFCWVHMSLLVIVLSRFVLTLRHVQALAYFSGSHFIVNNILEGLIWFWVPASLVICNDIFAYIWGTCSIMLLKSFSFFSDLNNQGSLSVGPRSFSSLRRRL